MKGGIKTANKFDRWIDALLNRLFRPDPLVMRLDELFKPSTPKKGK